MRWIALSALVLPALCAQTLPDADGLIKGNGAALKEHRSVQYVSEMTVEMTGQTPMKMGGEISMAFQNPGKMRMDSKMQGIDILMVSDGEATYAYNSMFKQYVKQNAALGPEGIVGMMGVQMPDMSKIKPVSKTLRDETIEVNGEKHDCWVVESKIDKIEIPGVAGAQASAMVLTFWFDKKLGIDLQMTTSMKMQMPGAGEMGMNQKMVKKTIKFDEPLPDSFFAFTPPADAKEVPTLMGSTLPKGDLAGKDAVAFEIKSLDANSYSLAALKGKPVLLDFWATWCGPCRKSIPVVEKLYQDFKAQGLVVLAIDAGEERAVVEEFLKKSPLPYPVVLSADSGIVASYQVSAFPTFIMIGRDGKIVAHEIGYGGEEQLRGMAKKAGLTEAAKEK
ncbi:MAG TPA: redoxin family protein [Bryobacteraceae bacterium]|nr:redoxin family protein [Bryobacteraceae bacterium]